MMKKPSFFRVIIINHHTIVMKPKKVSCVVPPVFCPLPKICQFSARFFLQGCGSGCMSDLVSDPVTHIQKMVNIHRQRYKKYH